MRCPFEVGLSINLKSIAVNRVGFRNMRISVIDDVRAFTVTARNIVWELAHADVKMFFLTLFFWLPFITWVSKSPEISCVRFIPNQRSSSTIFTEEFNAVDIELAAIFGAVVFNERIDVYDCLTGLAASCGQSADLAFVYRDCILCAATRANIVNGENVFSFEGWHSEHDYTSRCCLRCSV